MCHERRQQGRDGNGARWPACTHKTQRPRLSRIHDRSGSPAASGRNPKTARAGGRSPGRPKPIKTLYRFALFPRCKPDGFWRPSRPAPLPAGDASARRRRGRQFGTPTATLPARAPDRGPRRAFAIRGQAGRSPQNLRNTHRRWTTRLSYYSSDGLAAKHESIVLGPMDLLSADTRSTRSAK
jgi:hypothetical protein